MKKKKKKPVKLINRCIYKRTKHEWKTIRSYGFFGQEALCVRCGVIGTFVVKDIR